VHLDAGEVLQPAIGKVLLCRFLRDIVAESGQICVELLGVRNELVTGSV